MGDQTPELPPDLRHQMDDWAEQVREQQLGFLAAADDLDQRAVALRVRLAEAAPGAGTDGLRAELRWLTELATHARTVAKVPFLIPDEGVAVREDPARPGGLAYADPADVADRAGEQ